MKSWRTVPRVQRIREGESMKSGEIKRLLFLDCETTGLDEVTDELIEVAGALVDLQTREVLQSFDYLIQHTKPISFMPERWADVNWEEGLPLDFALKDVAYMMSDETIAGQNPGFDVRFIRAAMASCGIPYPDTDYHLVDVSSLVMPLVMAKRIEGISLRHTRLWAGATGEQSHRAGQDVADTIEVFFKACDVFNLGLATQNELDLALSNLQPVTCPDCHDGTKPGSAENGPEGAEPCDTCKGSGQIIGLR